MHVQRRRLAIAGLITAAAIAVPPAAFASGLGSPSGKPGSPSASPPACAARACKSPASPAASAAKSPAGPGLTVPGLSSERLQAGLAAAKPAGGDTPAGVAAFAAAAGVSQATAERVVQSVFGPKGGGASAGPAAFAAALASKLGVSTSAAQRALDQIEALSRGGIDPASPAFAAVAHDLGVSPDRLDAALAAAKGSLAGGPPNGK